MRPIGLVLLFAACFTNILNADASGANQCITQISSWKSLDLSGTNGFDADAQYRVKVYNDDGTPSSGWVYPVMVTPSIIHMVVSTAQFAFGSIESSKKSHWHYRKMGDSANRPEHYKNTEWKVAEIQMLQN